MKVVVSEQVLARLGELHPDQRREVRRALRDLAKGGGETKELAGVLASFHRLRVGRYRLVYRYGERQIEAMFFEHRSVVYELFRP